MIFGLQIKGVANSFETLFGERLKVAHILDWEANNLPVLVAVHSIGSSSTRWRFVSDIVTELDARNREWRSQTTVTVTFENIHEYEFSSLHKMLKYVLIRLSDPVGGRERFHTDLRSVLLTELYHDYAYVGQHGSLAATPDGPAVNHFVVGMQWAKGEIDESAVLATRVLSGALLLFEEVYYPAHLTYAAVGALGGDLFLQLLQHRRLIPILLPQRELAFISDHENRGDLYFLGTDMSSVLDRQLRAIESKRNLANTFSQKVWEATYQIELSQRVNSELLEVSKTPHIRDLLGLGAPRPQALEPVWAAAQLLRIGQVVKYYAISEQLGVDVVEFEPALAHLALARWGSQLKFHRIYQALDELQRTFESAALPDLGCLAERLGVRKCVQISSSLEGEAFRSWFWSEAADAVRETGGMEGEIAQRIKSLTKDEQPLPRELFLEVSETINGTEGLAARPDAKAALIRQQQFSAERFRTFLRERKIEVPPANSPCLCGSNTNFSRCCGRVFLALNQS